MSLIIRVDLTFVRRSIAVADILGGEIFILVYSRCLAGVARTLLTDGSGRSLGTRLCVLLLQLLSHFNLIKTY